MGMYDNLRCKYPLPLAGANELDYQTKSTPEQWCGLYEIREDGTLWHETYDIEDRSDPCAEGLHSLLGCMTRVNKSWEPCALTNEIRFYALLGNEQWIEFSAYMVKGKLHTLVQTSP